MDGQKTKLEAPKYHRIDRPEPRSPGSAACKIKGGPMTGTILRKLLTEQSYPASTRIGEMDTADMLAVMNAADAGIVAAVTAEISRIAAAVDAISGRIEEGGHLAYIGAGTSGRLGGLDASECPPTFN